MPPTQGTIDQIKEKPPVIINPNSIESRQKIIDDEAAEYLQRFTIDIAIAPDGLNLEAGKSITTNLSVRDPNGKAPKGNLPEAGLKISFDKKALTVFPESIIALDGGTRDFTIIANKTGTYDITFSLGKTVLGKRTIYVVKKGEKLEPESVEIRVAKTLNLASESNLFIVPKTKFGSYLTDTPYQTRYKINILKGKAKFCNLSKSNSEVCNPLLVAEQIEFGYNDSFRGYFKGKIVALDSEPIVFTVTKLGQKTETKSRTITVKPPTGLDKRNIYYDAILSGLKRNWWKTMGGYAYEAKEMTTSDTVEMLKRVLSYRVLKAGGDKLKRAGAMNLLGVFINQTKNLPDQKWTRGSFSKLLLQSVGTGLIKNKTSVLMDEQ